MVPLKTEKINTGRNGTSTVESWIIYIFFNLRYIHYVDYFLNDSFAILGKFAGSGSRPALLIKNICANYFWAGRLTRNIWPPSPRIMNMISLIYWSRHTNKNSTFWIKLVCYPDTQLSQLSSIVIWEKQAESHICWDKHNGLTISLRCWCGVLSCTSDK